MSAANSSPPASDLAAARERLRQWHDGEMTVGSVDRHRYYLESFEARLITDVGLLIGDGDDSARLIPVEYEIAGTRKGHRSFVVKIVSRGNDKWAVQDVAGNVLARDGQWEWEPQPSSRDDDFIARTRFASPAEALAAYDSALAALAARTAPGGASND